MCGPTRIYRGFIMPNSLHLQCNQGRVIISILASLKLIKVTLYKTPLPRKHFNKKHLSTIHRWPDY